MNLYRVPSDLLLLGEHCYLDCSDECYFTDVYDCRPKSGIKPTVLLIKQECASTIRRLAVELKPLLPPEWTRSYTFVAIPSSRGSNRPISAMLHHLQLNDIRELVVQREATPLSRMGWRLSPVEREEFFALNDLAADPKPSAVVLVDDVLTTGSHFRAARSVVRKRWPGLRIIGLFLARTCSRRKHQCYFNERRPARHMPWCCAEALALLPKASDQHLRMCSDVDG
jgi:hypoxanthine-guanine phosphoribosyltransferase